MTEFKSVTSCHIFHFHTVETLIKNLDRTLNDYNCKPT